jgi:hypothetical protein
MEIFLGDFNAKVGKEDILKPTIGNESLHEIINYNGVSVNLTLEILSSRIQCSHIATFITFVNALGLLWENPQ